MAARKSTGIAEERIRARAHEIWIEEGHPDGRHLDHWQRAEKELGQKASGQKPSGQKPATRSRPVRMPAEPPRAKPAATARRGRGKAAAE